MRHFEPQFKMKDYIKFLEWQEHRDEMMHKKRKEKDIKTITERKIRPMTFAEGMIVAYVAQLVLPTLWKAFAHNMGIQ